MIEIAIAFCFGAIFGSFLNVCIHRMPLEKSVVWPSSHCPNCEKRIPWFDNIPFISYISLGGKCRFCKKTISPRYLLVELLTAMMFGVFYKSFGLTFDLFIYLFFGCGLIIATFVDIKHRIIPDEVSMGGAVLGFILWSIYGLSLAPFSYNFLYMLNSFLGMVVGAGSIFLTGFIFDLIYFKLLKRPPIQGETSSMGFGDVKLMAMVGAFLGWDKALLTFFIAPFFGAIFGLANLAFKKDHTMPYGPFLALAAVISLFWSDQVIRFIFPVFFMH